MIMKRYMNVLETRFGGHVYTQCIGGLWAVRVPHGKATMRQGSAVNGCDHSFLVNNAALLIGWINN